MGRSLATAAVLGPLALLGACLQMAPTSSVPFRPTAERQTRYAAEIALAVKEGRRGEISEAAANGRMVLPQLPEIWGPPAADRQPRQAQPGLDLARLEPGAGGDLAERECTSMRSELPGATRSADCAPGWRGRALILPPLIDGSNPSAAALSTFEPMGDTAVAGPGRSG
jgi:hypothetical protein